MGSVNLCDERGPVMHVALIIITLLSAEPSITQLELLKTFRDEFVAITPGEGRYPAEVTMGRSEGGQASERPSHRIRLARPFAIARYEVTQNLWDSVMGSNPSRWKGPRNSCENFSYDEAQQFCRQVTTLMRSVELVQLNQVVRLPTEAEWEYAARAGTTSVYSFGDDPRKLDEYGWHTGNAAGNDPPVGAKKPNPWGLYDIHGYLWEWCADVWHDDYQGSPVDATAWNQGGDALRRVLRGGSWKDKPEQLTSSFRRAADKSTRDDAVGLRCVLARE